jgi:hypothetical protein
MVYPAQLRVIPLAPMMSPLEQGPMLEFRVVFVVIVAPHPTDAIAGGDEKVIIKPRTVRISRKVSGILRNFLSLKTDRAGHCVLYTV